MKKIQLLLIAIILGFTLSAKEYHVAKTGSDKNPGTKDKPLLTIQAAAGIAQPGDIITVHKGIYRERITPPRGGESHTKRIIYKAAQGEKVDIKGSEVLKNWEKYTGTVWKASIPDSFFGDYNPYKDKIHGDWFDGLGRIHHTGDVYLNGKSLWEMADIEKVKNPVAAKESYDPEGSTYAWFCESDNKNTIIYANFHEADPNKELVEINVRRTCFYPEKNNVDYITISGFYMSHAATQWAPPTAEQTGLIGTNWSKGWIIENNIISDSRCSGITLGKHGDEFDNTSEDSAEGYVETIHRAEKRGWSGENIGHHIIRNNTIFNCEQTGICGSLGAVFSTIENNDIYNIHIKRQFTGAEMAGIKIHAAIDMLIKNNRVANCNRGLWLDWMAQGTHVTGNLFYNNASEDLFVEVNHGPFLVDNNMLFSKRSILDCSEGGAYIHNLIAGNIELHPQDRFTPYHLPHSTEVAGLIQTRCGDNRYFNNIFVGGVAEGERNKSGLGMYENAGLPMFVNGNVYLNSARKFPKEENQLEIKSNPEIMIEEKTDGVYLKMDFDEKILKMKNNIVTTQLLGKALVSKAAYENPDGTPISIDTDYSGKKRDKQNPTAGPFENPGTGKISLKVWGK
ncbi:MAG TPA: right-handed parallel beta-helix repeat-containing protein, partial [Draconibacterium sp.]|nr:right-handed parallel beta-helix repeat-containing protein [Draconibacterium sp.]